MTQQRTFDVIVVGAGPAGLASAIALVLSGNEVAIVAPPSRAEARDLPGRPLDTRSAALFAGSIQLLRNLGAWDACVTQSAPLRAIRIVDGMEALIRAPEVTFHATELQLDAFGYNVPNTALVAALFAVASAMPRLTVIESAGVVALDPGESDIVVQFRDRSALTARLVVGADGRDSPSRRAAGIATRTWHYDQKAVACAFSHGRSHDSVSTELHRLAGPLTTVPMPGRASSLVWVERPMIAQRLMNLDEPAFRQALEARLQGLLGTVIETGPRTAFPLMGLDADRLGARRIALVGEAAHVLPPIGAQGLNLGFRDVATLAECVADARRAGEDIGSDAVLDRYTAARSGDVTSRTRSVDLLNRSLLMSSALPVHLGRGLGLFALKTFAPLRRLAIHNGLEPGGRQPPLMSPMAHAVARRPDA